jgi:N-acetylglutamate synthase-like GNAT family acetyltransferase
MSGAMVGDRTEAVAFYREQLGREVAIADDEELLLERDDGAVIAAVRLTPGHGTLELRTMVVDRQRQRTGVGSRLLARASRAIGDRECYCLCWSYLEGFYGQVGFVRVDPATLPEFLRERFASSKDQIAMHRAPR